MKYLSRKILYVLFALMMFGCAAPYKAPVSGPMAKLTIPDYGSTTFLDFSGGWVDIAPQDEKGCGVFKSTRTLKPGTGEFTINIPGDQGMFVYVFNKGYTSCHLHTLFFAEANKQYAIRNNSFCNISILEVISETESTPAVLKKAYESEWDGIKVCDEKHKL